ncbi:MAG: hypothetical protein IT285_07750 [Bdellovibrionales bacterium]|nr:hypothetical protein [Bdellovibrionales bacterium]
MERVTNSSFSHAPVTLISVRYIGYHRERPALDLERRMKRYKTYQHKVAIWNTFVDSHLPGVTDDDFSAFPRVLPLSYWPTLRQSVYLITKFTLKLLSLPEREIRAILPKGPIRDHLLDRLEVLRHRSGRITGSYRYDMAIVGPPDRLHPPQLLEINEIGFDGLARSTFFQGVLLDAMPDLRGRFKALDTASAEIRNMRRLGKRIARIQYDDYNWDEQFLHETAARMGTELRLVSPTQFGLKLKNPPPLLEQARFGWSGGRVSVGGWRPDAVNMSFAYGLDDYLQAHDFYRNLVRSKTPQYGSFLTGLVAAKTILILLDDPALRRKLLGSAQALRDSILPARLLSESMSGDRLPQGQEWVLKFTDGCGGEQVYMNEDLKRQIRRIPRAKRHEWVLQKKTRLNLLEVNGVLSRPKHCIADLGVFVQYDWAGGKFRHFEIGGLMARATNRSLKVNVSGGGLQVAVMLDRKS